MVQESDPHLLSAMFSPVHTPKHLKNIDVLNLELSYNMKNNCSIEGNSILCTPSRRRRPKKSNSNNDLNKKAAPIGLDISTTPSSNISNPYSGITTTDLFNMEKCNYVPLKVIDSFSPNAPILSGDENILSKSNEVRPNEDKSSIEPNSIPNVSYNFLNAFKENQPSLNDNDPSTSTDGILSIELNEKCLMNTTKDNTLVFSKIAQDNSLSFDGVVTNLLSEVRLDEPIHKNISTCMSKVKKDYFSTHRNFSKNMTFLNKTTISVKKTDDGENLIASRLSNDAIPLKIDHSRVSNDSSEVPIYSFYFSIFPLKQHLCPRGYIVDHPVVFLLKL